MADVDVDRLRVLAESAETRAQKAHWDNQRAEVEGNYQEAAAYLNDFFYWSGYKNAYRGIIAQIELQAIVDEEADAEPSCP